MSDSLDNNTVSVLGCGWLGFPLSEFLVEKGFRVNASTRSASRVDELEGLAIRPFVVDLARGELGQDGFYDAETLIVNIPFKDVEKFDSLIKRIEQSTIKKVIFVSSTSVYGNSDSPITEEDYQCLVSHPLLDIERLFTSSQHFKTTVVRFSGLIGYSRDPGRFFRSGRPVPNPESRVNLIHRDDCINILYLIIQKNIWGSIYNCSADTHPTKRAFYTHAAAKAGRPIPNFSESTDMSFKEICSSKVKKDLDYRFVYPDVFEIEYPE